jgi:hypothetical protein
MTNPSPFDPAVHRGANVLINDHLSVKPGENVLITTDTQSDPNVGPIIFNAAMQAGARPMLATINQLPLQGKLADPHLPDSLRAAMVSSDCWIDLTHPYIAGSQAQDDALKAGRTRCMVAGGMDCAALARLYGIVPMDALYELQREFDQLVAQSEGKTCRLTDDVGTDATFVLGKATGTKPRHAAKAGSAFSLPGSVVMYPDLPSVRGRIVIVAAMHEWYAPLQRPLTLEIDGRIKRIVEDGPEAQVLDRALRRAGWWRVWPCDPLFVRPASGDALSRHLLRRRHPHHRRQRDRLRSAVVGTGRRRESSRRTGAAPEPLDRRRAGPQDRCGDRAGGNRRDATACGRAGGAVVMQRHVVPAHGSQLRN